MSFQSLTAEKLASLPPAFVLITSFAGWIDWQKGFYIVSTVWVLLQIYFRLRKEHEKWKAKRDAERRDLLALHVRDMTADSE